MPDPIVIIPRHLERDTIAEANFELRFDTQQNTPSELLLGLLYQHFGSRQPHVESLPITQIPKQFVDADPNLQYLARHRISFENLSLLIGPQSIVGHADKPYVGWDKFKPFLLEAITTLLGTGLIGRISRYSLRYVNIFERDVAADWRHALKLNYNRETTHAATGLLQIRDEYVIGDYTNVIQLASEASLMLKDGGKLSGTYFDIDVIRVNPPNDFSAKLDHYLDEIHHTEKTIFFGLLTDATLQKLKPT